MSVFITLPAVDDPANSNKFLFFCKSQSVYKDSINFVNFSDQKFSLAIVLKLVLKFWVNLSLGVLIKFVLIKKDLYRWMNCWLWKPQLCPPQDKDKEKANLWVCASNYYRCIHNTRDWSPSKNPRHKLKLNPSARVKNTNYPFQIVVKLLHSWYQVEAQSIRPESWSTRRRLKHQCCHEEEILITCSHVHNFAKRHCGVWGAGWGAWCSQNLWKIFLQFEKEKPQATTSHQIYEGDDIPLTIAIATSLMKCVREKHSSTFIRHAGEFLYMDHYELTYVFILFINLLVIELILW